MFETIQDMSAEISSTCVNCGIRMPEMALLRHLKGCSRVTVSTRFADGTGLSTSFHGNKQDLMPSVMASLQSNGFAPVSSGADGGDGQRKPPSLSDRPTPSCDLIQDVVPSATSSTRSNNSEANSGDRARHDPSTITPSSSSSSSRHITSRRAGMNEASGHGSGHRFSEEKNDAKRM